MSSGLHRNQGGPDGSVSVDEPPCGQQEENGGKLEHPVLELPGRSLPISLYGDRRCPVIVSERTTRGWPGVPRVGRGRHSP